MTIAIVMRGRFSWFLSSTRFGAWFSWLLKTTAQSLLNFYEAL